jgi:hypothetical protein
MRVAFDDPNLVAFAGLELTTSLARTLDLAALIQRHVALAPGAGAANAGQKGMTLVSALLAGAEYIDDVDLLRAGNTSRGGRPPRRGAIDHRHIPPTLHVGQRASARRRQRRGAETGMARRCRSRRRATDSGH